MTLPDESWAELHLPPPDDGATSYRIGCGLRRTRYPDGTARQRRSYFHWPRSWTAQWTLSVDELQTFSAWLDAYGDTYQAITLVSGEDAAGAPVPHQVRFCSDLQVSGSGGMLHARAELEQASGLTPADPDGWTWPATLAAFDGYSYGEDFGLIRTPFEAAVARQARIHYRRPRMFAAHWQLSAAQLAAAEAWINAYGFAWFQAALLSSESAFHRASQHRVRCAGDPVVTYQPGGLYDLALSLEQSCANDFGALMDEVADHLLICIGGIRGAAVARADASGELSSEAEMAGAATAETMASGALESDLAGGAAGEVDADADWDTSLRGDAAARAVASGDLKGADALEGHAQGEADADGIL